MSNLQPDEQEDKPLDPAIENVRRRMVRLQLISASIMIISLMAVLGAIVYKVTAPGRAAATQALATQALKTEGSAAPLPPQALAALPAGFTVSDVSLSGSQILFYGTAPAGTRQAIVFDIVTQRILTTVTLGER
ncbi:hypothetical protein IFT84_19225 [Rhizobium sp. CFBP 8762]|uniref:hypothetical protein n=1 Tax=Rhizobium sp. CFBP 8762 TaxID=2775279 RepID=UPI00177E03DC|nr:hypothetical protein [Rhizobium sp. CFBP 8762]MBD8556645.1 hypothetical protein [Rhizobium sp. CFBP 8762]